MRLQSMRRTAQGESLGHKVMRMLKSKKGMTLLVSMTVVCMVVINLNIEENQRLLADHETMVEMSGDEMRDLYTDFENFREEDGGCDIGNPTQDADPAPENATRTLLTSYPGSGKRFTWTIIKALTNGEVADDWNYSEKLRKRPLIVKTSWPHKEGRW